MSNRRSRALIILFSIILWAQLIFTLGLMAWRYWGVFTRQFEIFVGVRPTLTDPLINSANKYCLEEAPVFYIGPSEADKYYVRYQFYPRKVTAVWVEPGTALSQEVLEKEFGPLDQLRNQGSCLLVDRLNVPLTGLGNQVEIGPGQMLWLLGN